MECSTLGVPVMTPSSRAFSWPGGSGGAPAHSLARSAGRVESLPGSGRETETRGVGKPAAAAGVKLRLLLVDDHAFFRSALRRLLDSQPDLQVCGEAADLLAAVELIAQLQPDLILLDLSLGDTDGLELFPHLQRSGLGGTPVIVLSMHEGSEHVARARAAGASAYVPKSQGTARMLAAVRDTLSGRPGPA